MHPEIEAMLDDLQALCARHNLHWAHMVDPDTGKTGVLLAHAKSVPSMKYMELLGLIDPIAPQELQ